MFVSASIPPQGTPGRVVAAAIRGEFVVISHDEHKTELRRLRERGVGRSGYPLDRTAIDATIEFLRTTECISDLPIPPVRCRDPKDDYLLACAVAGQAHYLVTGDRDLLALDGETALGPLRVLTPLDLLAALDARRADE